MRKAMTGAIILEDPGDKGRKKASTLATRLEQIWDPATVRVAVPARIAELRVVGPKTCPSPKKSCGTPWRWLRSGVAYAAARRCRSQRSGPLEAISARLGCIAH